MLHSKQVFPVVHNNGSYWGYVSIVSQSPPQAFETYNLCNQEEPNGGMVVAKSIPVKIRSYTCKTIITKG